MSHADRPGVALLEAIVALTIFAAVAGSIALFATTSLRAVGRARDAEREVMEASAFVDAVTLWSRSDFDRRLGSHEQGRWRLELSRPLPTVYVIALLDGTSARPLIITAVYRPRFANATQ